MTKEVLKLALEAYLCREMPAGTVIGDPKWWVPKIANAIKEALNHIPDAKKMVAQPEQEPVAWLDAHQPWDLYKNKPQLDAVPLYTTPPQRKPLSDEETIILKGTTCPEIDWKARHGVEMNNGERNQWMLDWFMAFKVAIEAAHGIKE